MQSFKELNQGARNVVTFFPTRQQAERSDTDQVASTQKSAQASGGAGGNKKKPNETSKYERCGNRHQGACWPKCGTCGKTHQEVCRYYNTCNQRNMRSETHTLRGYRQPSTSKTIDTGSSGSCRKQVLASGTILLGTPFSLRTMLSRVAESTALVRFIRSRWTSKCRRRQLHHELNGQPRMEIKIQYSDDACIDDWHSNLRSLVFLNLVELTHDSVLCGRRNVSRPSSKSGFHVTLISDLEMASSVLDGVSMLINYIYVQLNHSQRLIQILNTRPYSHTFNTNNVRIFTLTRSHTYHEKSEPRWWSDPLTRFLYACHDSQATERPEGTYTRTEEPRRRRKFVLLVVWIIITISLLYNSGTQAWRNVVANLTEPSQPLQQPGQPFIELQGPMSTLQSHEQAMHALTSVVLASHSDRLDVFMSTSPPILC